MEGRIVCETGRVCRRERGWRRELADRRLEERRNIFGCCAKIALLKKFSHEKVVSTESKAGETSRII
jgi:hypothetical protein